MTGTPLNGPSGKSRWWWYSYERAPSGGFGPFGPVEARHSAEARRIAAKTASQAGLHLDRIEPVKDEPT